MCVHPEERTTEPWSLVPLKDQEVPFHPRPSLTSVSPMPSTFLLIANGEQLTSFASCSSFRPDLCSLPSPVLTFLPRCVCTLAEPFPRGTWNGGAAAVGRVFALRDQGVGEGEGTVFAPQMPHLSLCLQPSGGRPLIPNRLTSHIST